MKAEFIKPRNKVDGGKYLSTNRLSVIKCVTNDKSISLSQESSLCLGLVFSIEVRLFTFIGEERRGFFYV